MRTRSKLLPILMSLVLAVSLCPAPAFAANLTITSTNLAIQAAGTDDYPSNLKNAAKDSVVDPWRFYNRECTSFVAWRLNNDNGVAFNNYYGGAHWGNANNWGPAARSLGITVDSNPAVGSVAWWSSGTYGHVAWVQSVSGNNVTIEEYNYNNKGTYNRRTIAKSNVSGFIHLKDIQANQDPIGAFDECWTDNNLLVVRGWSFDPDSPDKSVGIHVYVGGPAGSGASCYTTDAVGNTLLANNQERPDIGRKCGFKYVLSVKEKGDQPVYVYAINNEGGNNPLLSGSPRMVAFNADPYGFFDECWGSAGTVRVRGWVYDSDSYDTPVKLHVYVGGPAGSKASCYRFDATGDELVANQDRPDLGKACGYDYTIPVKELGNQPVYVYAINNEGGNNPLLTGGPKSVQIENSVKPADPTEPMTPTVPTTPTDDNANDDPSQGAKQQPGSATAKPTSIADAVVTGVKSKTYTGRALAQSPTVKVNGKTLKAGTDYELTYSDNVKAGTATMMVNGKGSYTGTKAVTFTISKANVKSATAAKVKAQKYRKGKAIKPSPKLAYKGAALKKGTDYTLTYKNNKKRGTATITVKGKGNFKGTKVIKFKIK